jgi:succinate-semialdehyde dehydrogenase / glutarate-semialdehyde dehydrogenase
VSEIVTINPFTEKEEGRYVTLNTIQIKRALEKADRAYQAWRRTALVQRTDCLRRMAACLRAEKEGCAILITREMGKPLLQAIAEIEKCAALCVYYADEGEGFLERETIESAYAHSERVFQPIGVILAIMPWNYPFWQVMRAFVPNLLLGNALILKPAPNVMGSALKLEELAGKAGFPDGLFQSVCIDVESVSSIIHDPCIQGVTFTGSARAGRQVAAQAGQALKKVVLELGGSDPYVILDDADLPLAAESCVRSRLNNAGQVCIAAKRIIVVEKVRRDFEALLLEYIKPYICGDPMDPAVLLGPMARRDLRTQLDEQLQRSKRAGARCILGGELPKGPGYFYPATLLLGVTEEAPAFQEELFGPVIGVTGAGNEKEALRLANQTVYGLGAAIFSRDSEKAEGLARDFLEAGFCVVNGMVCSDPRLPFGGIKQSGYGRELAREGLWEFANIKTVALSSYKNQ